MGSDLSNLIKSIAFRFQSTLPHGERLAPALGPGELLPVSIHAPTWGATEFSTDYDEEGLFQSTLPHGERLCPWLSADHPGLFQSTLPHRERHGWERKAEQ